MNRLLTEKPLMPGNRYHRLRKTFSQFYFRNLQLIIKYKCNLKVLLTIGIYHQEFYGDVVSTLRKSNGHIHFQTLYVERRCAHVLELLLKRVMIHCYCNVLHIWWSVGIHASLKKVGRT